MVRDEHLDLIVVTARFERDPAAVRAALDRASRRTLRREALRYVPLPPIAIASLA